MEQNGLVFCVFADPSDGKGKVPQDSIAAACLS